MGKTVYLIGHGRVHNTETCHLPGNVTMHWLVPLGDVTAGLSYAFLSGGLNKDYGASEPRSHIKEHYLCSDVHSVNDKKISDFFSRAGPHPHDSTDPYILMPRYKTNLSLSSISRFISSLSPSGDWHLYWTCCRGYLGVRNPYRSEWDKANQQCIRVQREDPEATPALDEQGHTTRECDFSSVIMVAKSDWNTLKPSNRTEQLLGVDYSKKIHRTEVSLFRSRHEPHHC